MQTMGIQLTENFKGNVFDLATRNPIRKQGRCLTIEQSDPNPSFQIRKSDWLLLNVLLTSVLLTYPTANNIRDALHYSLFKHIVCVKSTDRARVMIGGDVIFTT